MRLFSRPYNNQHPQHTEDAYGSHGHDIEESSFSRHRQYIPPNRFPKLDFPRFDSANPRGWIQKADIYFLSHDIEEHKKADIAAIYLEGKAEKWFLNFQVNIHRITWIDLAKSICARFENPMDENFVESFNKLVHTTTVDDYYKEFESLKALMLDMNPSLTEKYFVISFLSSLKDEI